uniref:Uncharacterized protein n=1 Tax=Heterorhabditis bacteriophora TaxID=37862 RepID=A0A1I7XA56_HETBA
MKSTEQKLQQPIAHSPAQKTLPFNSDEKELQSTQSKISQFTIRFICPYNRGRGVFF